MSCLSKGAKQKMSESDTIIKTSDMELRHCRTLLQKKESEIQTNDASYTKDKKLHDQIQVEVQNLTAKLSQMNYEEGSFETLNERRNFLHHEIRQLKQQLDRKNAYNYEMQYRDPEPNFDRSKVYGMVGKLITVLNEKNYLALMMTAGGSVSL